MINVVVLLFIFWFVLSMAWWFIIYKQKYHFVLFFIFIIRYVSLLQNYLINFAKLLYIQTRITEKKSGCSKEVLSLRFQITPQLIVNIELNRFYHSLKFNFLMVHFFRNTLYITWVVIPLLIKLALQKFDPDNFQEDDPCSGHKSSCDFLKFLTGTCGVHYSSCHSAEERKEIIR